MPQSNRRHQFAIRGCLTAFLFVASPVGAQQDEGVGAAANRQTTSDKEKPERASRYFAERNIVDSHTYRAVCEQPKDVEHADLCQQWRMAEAADAQLWLNALGLAFISATLVFNAWSARAAARSARAAERALTDLERPHVYFEIRKPGFGLAPGIYGGITAGFAEHLEFCCVNFGRTPAEIWEVNYDIRVVPRDQWPEPLVADPRAARERPPGVVSVPDAPFCESVNLRQYISFEQLQMVGTREVNLFFIGYVRYLDIFGRRHVTGCCAIYDPIGQRFVLRGDERYNYARDE